MTWTAFTNALDILGVISLLQNSCQAARRFHPQSELWTHYFLQTSNNFLSGASVSFTGIHIEAHDG